MNKIRDIKEIKRAKKSKRSFFFKINSDDTLEINYSKIDIELT